MQNKCAHCETAPKKPFYKERLFLVSFFILIVLAAALFIPILKPLLDSFIEYSLLIWWALLLGFAIGGGIDYFIPRKYISKYFAKHKKRTIIYSVLFGFLMSACSHGILAIAMELYKKGAATPSVIAFLLASPWANLPITVLLFGFFGVKALFIIISAIVIAIITGLIFQFFDKRGWIERNIHSEKVATKFSILQDMKIRWSKSALTAKNLKNAFRGVLKGSLSLTKMVLWWILIGMFFASVARAYIPHDFFVTYMGPTLFGLLVTLVLATIIEVCSEGTAPLAFEIFNQTKAFGNSFTFLMAGVATDYTEIGLIWSNIGKRTAILLPVVTVPQIIILGYLFNILF